MTYIPVQVHWCGTVPCTICGAGYAPGVFRVEKVVGTVAAGLSDADIDRIADRVAEKLARRRMTSA